MYSIYISVHLITRKATKDVAYAFYVSVFIFLEKILSLSWEKNISCIK